MDHSGAMSVNEKRTRDCVKECEINPFSRMFWYCVGVTAMLINLKVLKKLVPKPPEVCSRTFNAHKMNDIKVKEWRQNFRI